MTQRHTETYRIRHDECDAYGVLNNAAYLRLAQETAWRHTIATGFGYDYYEDLQRAWVARDTSIEYLQPVTFGNELSVTTHVPSARRSIARRVFEFRLDGELVADSRTDYVYLDIARQAPASIPSEIFDALSTDDDRPAQLKREPFPEPASAPPGVVTWKRRVEWRDVDSFGHLNNASYLSYTQEAAIEAGIAYGVTHASSVEAGLGWALKRSRIEYLQPALPDEELQIETWLTSLRQASAERFYSVTRLSDGEQLARAKSHWLTMDIDSGKPRRLPKWMREALAPNLSNRG
ncbi:MAG: acyl-[acyl-carrier-protein] thioesterase [Anaerolineales bacterium]